MRLRRARELLEKDLTEKIIAAACLEVSNALGAGFLESVDERALLIALTEKGLKAETQVPLKVVLPNNCSRTQINADLH